MKVFLSWSGEKSRAVADALKGWLPQVIQDVEPFMSAEDISAGVRWQERIASELDGTGFGILCVTRENQSAPWLNFEAGAIAKQVELSRVVPLAIDLSTADVKPPLGQFQAKEASKEGILAVLRSINELIDKPVADLDEAGDVWWPRLESKLNAAVTAAPAPHVRSERDLLEEILTTVRALGDLGSPGRRMSEIWWTQHGIRLITVIKARIPDADIDMKDGRLVVSTTAPVPQRAIDAVTEAASTGPIPISLVVRKDLQEDQN